MPWDEVDRLLTVGEPSKDKDTGAEGVTFPSYHELALRYGVSKTTITKYATTHKVMKRRVEIREREQALFEDKLIERRSAARVLGAEEVIGVVNEYILGFKKSLSDGKVRTDSAVDFDRMIRLRELLAGNADGRQELTGVVTLESLQQRHQRVRQQVDALAAELTGVMPTADVSTEGADGARN